MPTGRAGAEPGERFAFELDYRLGEYLDFVIAHALDDEILLRTAKPWQLRLFKRILAAMASVLFVYKKIRMGRCAFVIDATGISRTTRRGTSAVAWERVRAIHRYPPGWLIELREGAVPLPERALPDGATGWLADKASHVAARPFSDTGAPGESARPPART